MLALVCLSFLGVALGAPTSCNLACHTSSPVCGSDGQTYRSSCDLDTANCKKEQLGLPHIRLSYRGSCGNILGGYHTSTCDQICNEEKSPVCASDGVVYENKCRFTLAQCAASKNGTRLSIVSYTTSCPTPVEANCEKFAVNTSDIALEGPLGGSIQTFCPLSQMSICTNHGTFRGECELCRYIDSFIEKFKINPSLKVPDFKILYNGTCHYSGYPQYYPGGPVVANPF
ncbi:ovomucoid-like [Haliotis cracherodii]|uniref:ovomucoid-like n=1 Tax=Haliotis cracherodii TaxID=6455 RepID=UPI0039E884B5